MADLDLLLAEINQPPEKMDYEQAYSQLEEIVQALETGEYSLEVSLQLYERGQLLARYCTETLDKAELKVQQLSGESLAAFNPPE